MDSWAILDSQERFVFNKLLTGSFRVGVSQNLVIKALADISGLEPAVLTHRIMGSWLPETYQFSQLMADRMPKLISPGLILSSWPILSRKRPKNKKLLLK